MIYPRLKLARNLLSDDGVIFISIDDNEQANLKKVCDEIFGEQNFIAQIVVDQTPKNDPLLVATSHEYMLCYFRNILVSKELQWGSIHPLNRELNELIKGMSKSEAENTLAKYYTEHNLTKDNISNYKYVDEGGIFRTGPLDDPQGKGPRDDRINLKTGNILKVPSGGWRANIDTWNEWVASNLIEFPENDDFLASKKTYLSTDKYEVGRSVIKMQGRKATSELNNLFDGKNVFNNPKSVEIIKNCIENLNDKSAIVIDFFSGSGTTAEATMKLNAEDGGKRKYILVQLPEDLDENLKNASGKSAQTIKNGIEVLDSLEKPHFITEIGKERIRRAAKKIKEDFKDREGIENLDTGFRVLKLDTSNMRDVYYNPADIELNVLENQIDNVKDDRNEYDLLFQVMLDFGIELSSAIKEFQVGLGKYFSVADGFLCASFDDDIDTDIVKAMAKSKASYAIFKDSSFKKDSDRINLEQIFNELSPNTEIKVI